MSIDWFAVDCVVSGTPLNLQPEERVAAVRRLQHKLIPNGHPPTLGLLTSEEVGRRIGVTARTVDRIKEQMPAADKLKCDVCGAPMWVRYDDFIEPHADDFFKECPMSGQFYRADWESELANRVVWLARRLRDGDSHGVWEYVERLEVGGLRRMLVAALAGFQESGNPYEWLQEAV